MPARPWTLEQRNEATRLEGNIDKLKADCEEVRKLRDKLDARTKTRTFGPMFELFGSKARKLSLELSSALSSFYADDQRMIQVLSDSLTLADKALAEVENALGPPGF